MVCFCHHTSDQLRLALPKLAMSASVSASAQLTVAAQRDPPLAADLKAIAAWLAGLGLPAAPWTPDPSWRDLTLPTLSASLNASAMATISAFAQLRADALAQFGIDLLNPAQSNAFIRMVATLNARLSAMLSADLALDVGGGLIANARMWAELSATLTAVAQVEAALALGLLPTPPPLGPPLSLWRAFLRQLRALLPLISASLQLGMDVTAAADVTAQLSAMLRVMASIQLPGLPMPTLSLMANLTAALSAVAQLRQALGVDPLAVGLPEIQAMVAARVSVTARLVESTLGITLSQLLAQLLQTLGLEYCPTLMAPPPVVSAAIALSGSASARALASVRWQVPTIAALPVLSVGLPAVALATQLNAALGLTASLAPCASGCDAAALLRDSLALTAAKTLSAGAGVAARASISQSAHAGVTRSRRG